MEYQVPQFIEIESKVVGPLTLKQFIYVMGGGGISFACIHFLPTIFGLLGTGLFGGLGLALAFYKINGKPFADVLEAGFSYYTHSKLFLWKHDTPEQKAGAMPETMRAAAPVARAAPRLSSGKLSKLAWSLDIQDQKNAPAEELGPEARP